MDRSLHAHVFSVLVGDDDLAIRESVVELLSDRPLRIFTASTGSAALKTLLRESIDFTILDVEMPDMTGPQVLEAYLSGPWVASTRGPAARSPRRRLPAIFMSGNPAVEIRTRCQALGSEFLDKPFTPDDMRAAVDAILHRF